MLEELIGKRAKVAYKHWRPGDQKVYISDISKSREKLKWMPKINPREGVGRLIQWIRQNIDIFKT